MRESVSRSTTNAPGLADDGAAPSRLESALVSLRGTPLRRLGGAVVAVAVLTGVMAPFRDQLGVLNVLLLYLLLTFMAALSGGLWPGVLCAVLGFLAFDVLFIPPYLTLSVAEPDHVLALFVYLGVAIVTARLVSGMRERTEEAVRESQRTALLAELNAALIGDVTLDAILARIAERVVTVYGAQASRVLVRGEDGELRTGAHFPPEIGPDVDRTGLALAEWTLEKRQPVGRSTRGRRIVGAAKTQPPPLPVVGGQARPDVLYLPIKTASRVVGVLEVIGRPGKGAFRAEDERLMTTFVDQAALALERARMSEEAAQAAILAQSDELKSALLAAVSHDLRTPLASIKASATSLLDQSVAWDVETRQDFLEAIDEETDRLTLMVGNLLDLSRIEGGALRPQKDWYDVDELIADVRARTAARTEGRPVSIEVEPDLPLLRFDYVEIAQVLLNLIENAARYTPAGTPIAMGARRVSGAVEVFVRDEGPGILAEEQPRLFDKFYRAPSAVAVNGTGIGLAISKGLVEAHGGRIWLDSAPGAGTVFRFTLPLAAETTGNEGATTTGPMAPASVAEAVT